VEPQEPPAAAAARPDTGLRAIRSLLRRNPDFRRLFGAQAISFGGDWFLTVALFGLVDDLTTSPIWIALVVVAQLLPYLLLSPVAGLLVDRMNRRILMIVADLARVVLCLGFLLVDDPSLLWLVFVLQVGLAVFGSVFEPASAASVPNLVEDEDLPLANALSGSLWGTMLAVGAAIGGLVSASLGRDAAFVGDALSFGLSALILVRIRRPLSEHRDAEEEHPGLIESTAETFRYARRDHRVLALLAVKGGFGLAGGVLVLLPVFARDVFHGGDAGFGGLMAARGVGVLLGPFLAWRIAGRTERGLYTGIGLALASFGVFYCIFPFMPSLALAAPFAALAHLGGGAQWTLSTYGLQAIVPDRLRGRVFAFDFALVTLSISISNLLAGWAAARFGPRPAMIGLALIGIAYAAVWWVATARVRQAADATKELHVGTASA
jgi:MFS family permease